MELESVIQIVRLYYRKKPTQILMLCTSIILSICAMWQANEDPNFALLLNAFSLGILFFLVIEQVNEEEPPS